MVVPGKTHSEKASPEEVAERTLRVLRRTVAAAVPSINFLSGGLSPQEASANLNAINAASISAVARTVCITGAEDGAKGSRASEAPPGVALVEVGGSSTGVAIFHEGKIRHLASLKYAGAHVTSDLVQGLGVTQSDAERLKERHGAAYTPLVDAGEMVSLPSTPGQGARSASRASAASRLPAARK